MKALNVCDYEIMAREKLPQMVYDYYAGGAGDEITVEANHQAWKRIRLRPRILVDVAEQDLSTTVMNQPISMPILTAPAAFNAMAHPDGECAVARATGFSKTIQILSTFSTYKMEDVAAESTGPRWFQLYCVRDRGITRALVERAETSGYSALCLTVDAPLLGRRERDVRNEFKLPDGMSMKNLESLPQESLTKVSEGSALEAYFTGELDSSLTWESIEWFRSLTRLPILLKGVMAAEDAKLAVESGVEGIIVSNHGGRQLDGTMATCDALPEIVDAVAGQAEVFVDGGIRRGADVLKALAMGARAVLIGRPYLWGLSVGGEDGVRQILELLRAELSLSMAVSGRPTIDSIDRTLIA